jgi:hypothetical protein
MYRGTVDQQYGEIFRSANRAKRLFRDGVFHLI